MSSLRFQESTTIATAVSGIGSMMVDPYAPVRRMSIDTPPQQDSHAPAVLRGAALQIGGHAVAIALTAASTIVLTRFLGVDDYGRFTVLTVFLLIGVSLSEFGLNGTAIRWFAGGERPEEVFASLIGLRLVLSTLAAVVALVIFALYPHNDAPVTAALITAAALILAGVNLTIPTALQARLDFRLAVGLDLTARAVSFATYAIAALVITADDPDRRLVAAVGGLAAGYLVSLVVGLVAVSRLSSTSPANLRITITGSAISLSSFRWLTLDLRRGLVARTELRNPTRTKLPLRECLRLHRVELGLGDRTAVEQLLRLDDLIGGRRTPATA